MSETTIYTYSSYNEVHKAASSIPQEACKGTPLGQAALTRIGIALLGRIKNAFVVKSLGGTDEAGERWAPLSRYTLALRGKRDQSKETKQPTQTKIRGKGKGAALPFDKYAKSTVNTDILRDTGALLNSLSPGVASSEQVFQVGQSSVTVGTTREGAAKHHSGVPGKLPQRRLWPHPNKWPPSWWDELLKQARDGIVDIAIQLIENLQ